jgi:hypothetical protein
VDVFSVRHGNWSVNLSVNPWISPSGLTRGGNLDVSVELRDVNGALLLTNNSAGQTFASVQTNLAEGIYYLYVRNSGAGNPQSSAPTGYTPYGSIGQYFITGFVTPSGFVIPPGAELQITDITQPGTGAKQFTITYSDNAAIDVSTIDDNDVRVTGPNGFSRAAHLVSISSSTDGTPRMATYSVDAPAGGSWMTTG